MINSKRKECVVLRPYGARIRNPVFRALGRCGIVPRAENIFEDSLSDQEICMLLSESDYDLILCPFKAVRLPDGSTTDGLKLLQTIRRERPLLLRVPVFMPISQFSGGVFESHWRNGSDGFETPGNDLKNAILVIRESELTDEEAVANRMQQHMQQFGNASLSV